MKLKRILLSTLFLVAVSGVWASEISDQPKENILSVLTINDDYITHTVTGGDTVYSLARKYKTTVDAISQLNPEAKNGIKSGQVLKIPASTDKKAKGTSSTNNSSYTEHVVLKGETLYGISKIEETTVETIFNLNPQLKDGLKEGMVLKTPRKKTQSDKDIAIHQVQAKTNNNKAATQTFTEHKVKKGETLYSLTKTYNISAEELLQYNPDLKNNTLKSGMKVRIPNSINTLPGIVENGSTIQTPRSINANEPIKIGVLFPFLDNKASVQKEKLIEYYEGFLLSVKNLKEAGLNAEIYTFDTGAEKDIKRLKNILETSEVNNLHLIIGGTSQAQIDLMTDFSQKTGVRYVIPFGVKKDILNESPNVFQMNLSHTVLYDQIVKAFIDKFRNSNIIFITEQGSNMDKNDYVTVLKKALNQENISFRELRTGDKVVEEMKSALNTTKNNVFVPTSSSEISLRKITGVLVLIPNESVTLFGYPEWQTYLHMGSQLHKYDTYIYTSFYLDESNGNVQAVMSDYKKWYNKNIALSFPKFAFLGYDAALFFISGLDKYKNRFDAEIPYINMPTLQRSIHFTREKEGVGYQNTGFYFVHFKKDSTVEKIEYK